MLHFVELRFKLIECCQKVSRNFVIVVHDIIVVAACIGIGEIVCLIGVIIVMMIQKRGVGVGGGGVRMWLLVK